MSLEERIQDKERTLLCQNCAAYVVPIFSESGPHIRADCPSCGRYIKFVRQNLPPEEREHWDSLKQRP